jgi:hypothetical protein
MTRRIGRAAAGAVVLVVAGAGTSQAAITWGPQSDLPRAYTWNYGNAMDFTGTPGTTFRLTDVFVSDATLPQAAFATSSGNGTSWTASRRLSPRTVNAEAPTIAAAGRTPIAGWMTGFSAYDPAGAPRRVQIVISSDRASTWGRPKNLSARGGAVDYPVVAAAKTSFGTINLYAVWVDAETGKVLFRERASGSPWSAPIRLGLTTRATSTGYSGLASIAAVGDLVVVAWIADGQGTVKARAIDLFASGSATAAATRTAWGDRRAMAEPVALRQHGAPVVSASRLVPGVATIAWSAPGRQVFARVTGEAISPGVTTIVQDGPAAGFDYTGGYATAVEPAPGGGFVAMWAACRDTILRHDCNVRRPEARIDLLSAAWSGSAFDPPALVASAKVAAQRINDAPSIVATPGYVYAQYDGSTSSGSDYDVFARVATSGP